MIYCCSLVLFIIDDKRTKLDTNKLPDANVWRDWSANGQRVVSVGQLWAMSRGGRAGNAIAGNGLLINCRWLGQCFIRFQCKSGARLSLDSGCFSSPPRFSPRASVRMPPL